MCLVVRVCVLFSRLLCCCELCIVHLFVVLCVCVFSSGVVCSCVLLVLPLFVRFGFVCVCFDVCTWLGDCCFVFVVLEWWRSLLLLCWR